MLRHLLRALEDRATLTGLNHQVPEGPDLSPLLRIEQMIADSIESFQDPQPPPTEAPLTSTKPL